jgi:2'-5' RNA ligase
VLTPVQDNIVDKFYNITNNLESIADDYLLQKKRSLPHITITKIELEEKQLLETFNKIKSISLPKVTPAGLALLNKGHNNFAYILLKRTELANYFKTICKTVEIEYDEDIFMPHISLLSFKVDESIVIEKLNDYKFIFNEDIKYKVAIGITDEVGQVEKLLID